MSGNINDYTLRVMIGQEMLHIEYPENLMDARARAHEWIQDLQEEGAADDPRVLIIPTGWKKPLEIWKPRRLQDDLLAERLEVVS